MNYYILMGAERHGPLEATDLLEKYSQGEIARWDLIWREGLLEWTPMESVLDLTGVPPPAPSLTGRHASFQAGAQAIGEPANVHKRGLFTVTALTLLTAGIYWVVYIVPKTAQDMETITGRKRIQFSTACTLAICTIGFSSVILSIIYAFELQEIGSSRRVPEAEENLGLSILLLNIGGFLLGIASPVILGLTFLFSVLLSGRVAYMLQKEINLYAAEK